MTATRELVASYATCGGRLMALAACVWMVVTTGCSSGRRSATAATDIEALRAADTAYTTAWLTNDPEKVMATLTDDAVIVPSGMAAIEGADAIRSFWWPADSPTTTVTEFTAVQQEIHWSGDWGWVRGTFTLAFEYAGKAHSSGGEYLSLLRRIPDGSWRISHRMWSDRPQPE